MVQLESTELEWLMRTSDRQLADVAVGPSDQCPNIELRGPNLSQTMKPMLMSFFILLVPGRSPLFAAVWLICCALATWSDESEVAADRGWGALSQHLKPVGGLQTEAALHLR